MSQEERDNFFSDHIPKVISQKQQCREITFQMVEIRFLLGLEFVFPFCKGWKDDFQKGRREEGFVEG